ncbi:MAG TPA: hypothetical protein VFN74_17100 [Chloroflexota bacterium]|nr:hypothetical protein [Chloroflexota bacterium]
MTPRVPWTVRPTATRRRHVLGAGLAATGSAWLAACGGADGGTASTSQKRSVQLRYTTFWNQQRLDVIAPAIRQFEEEFGHKVSMEPTTNYAEKLVVEFASGTAADAPPTALSVVSSVEVGPVG